MNKPSIEEIRHLVSIMIERSYSAWIGEGSEIAQELLDYIDGRNPTATAEWEEGMDKWAYIVSTHDPGQRRGPFDSYQKAKDFLASMPEHATARSPIGPTLDRDSYVVMTRAEIRHEL